MTTPMRDHIGVYQYMLKRAERLDSFADVLFKKVIIKTCVSLSRSTGNNLHRNKWFVLLMMVAENQINNRLSFIAYLETLAQPLSKNYHLGYTRLRFALDLIKLGPAANESSNRDHVGETGLPYTNYKGAANYWYPIFQQCLEPNTRNQVTWFLAWAENYNMMLTDCGHFERRGYEMTLIGNRDSYSHRQNVCRQCSQDATNDGSRIQNHNGQLILTEFAVEAHGRGNHLYITDSRVPGLTRRVHNTREIWVDESWTPYGDLLANYHSSRQRGFTVIDSPWFQRNRRAFGMELEVQNRTGDLLTKLGKVHEALNHQTQEVGEYCYFERDGSIGEGFEIVTQPAGLDVHTERMAAFLQNGKLKMGLRSHEGGACGLHIHVGREFLTQGQIYRVQAFLNDVRNESLIRSIARRYDNGYCRFKPHLAKFTIQNKHSTERYEALNVTNPDTIEFRIFRGSLRYESVMAALEFVNALLTFCTPGEVSLVEFTALGFKKWLIRPQNRIDTKYLRSYLAVEVNHDNEREPIAA